MYKNNSIQEFTDEFVKSSEFLKTYEWRRVRKYVLTKYEGRCMCCGRTASDDIVLNVDHIKPRKTHPELALEASNLQILCNECNHGKGNWNTADWRDSASFIVTDRWLESFKTAAGGMTRAQVKALTGKSAPKAGWKKALIGTRITQQQRRDYEQGKDKHTEKTIALKERSRLDKEKSKLKKELEMLELKLQVKQLTEKLNKTSA